MKKIEAVIKPYRLDEIRSALEEMGLVGMTVSEVRGFALRPAGKNVHLLPGHSGQMDDFVPSLKIEVVVHDSQAEAAIDAIIVSGRLDSAASGLILAHPLVDAVRIRTEERNDAAI